jgi:hypothetical protein
MVQQLFIDFKKTYDLFKRKVLYNILTEFGMYTHETALDN